MATAHRRLRLPADHRSPAAARSAVREVLVDSGHTDLLDEALLLTTELATNGVVHAGTDIDVDIDADEQGVTVTVTDYRSGPIETALLTVPSAMPDITAEHGRGLLLVDQFATSWGTTHDPTGKGVWFRLERARPNPDRPVAAGQISTRRRDRTGELAEPADQLVWLVHVSDDLRLRLSLPQLVSELLVRLCEVLDAPGGLVHLDRADGRGERCVARQGTGATANPPAASARANTPTGPPAADTRANTPTGPPAPGTRANTPAGAPADPALVVPLPLPRPLSGRIELLTAEGQVPAADWLPLATLSAERMAVAVEHDRLRDDDRDRRSWLTYLAEASELLAQSLDVSLTLALVPQLVVPRLGEWCAVHVLDEYGELQLAASTHAEESALPTLRRLLASPDSAGRTARGGAGEAGRTGTADADVTDRLHELLDGGGSVTLPRPVEGIAVPLVARGGVLGTLSVGRPADRLHAPDDVAVVSDIARRAALAIENARIHAERDEVSQAFQRALLPAELPRYEGLEFAAEYEPAGTGTDVGGDFYDVVELTGGQWLMCIGDVCGKGPQAAALTGLVRNVIRVLVRDHRPLERIVELLNQTLLESGDASRYCTLAMAVVTPGPDDGLDVQLCLSGHDRPYLLPALGLPEPVGECGTAVGLLDEVEVSPVKLRLNPGDALVFYTDGVTERRRGGRLFGHHRLSRELTRRAGTSAAAVAAGLVTTVRMFSTEPPRDDIAVLVLKNSG